jgi:peptidoglycan/xylan/chitin deacetylase (PgdA/CDA1 family)
MFLKRFMVLAAGVLLAIVTFVIYFEYSRTQMDARFAAERAKFHLDGPLQLTAANAPTPAAAPAPAPSSGADTNSIIGPVPPAGAPDSTTNSPSPAPSADSNAAPVTPSAPSTFNSVASPFQFAAYQPALLPLRSAIALGQTAPAAAGPATQDTPAGESSVIVLLYHQFVPAGQHVSPKLQWTMQQDVFESEMKYIHDNGYHVVPMSDVLAFVHHQKTLPPGSVCITIDDGYKSPLVFAKPILDKYGYPWTFFIYPQFINDTPSSSYRGAASWPELLELQKQGVDIECHSMTHPILTKHGSKTPEEYAAWLENETAGAKKVLEQHMGRPIISFAYPYGEWNKQVQAAAIAAGFQAIFTVADNPVHSTTNPYSIGRYTITQNVVRNFAAYLHQSALSLTKADPEPGATISNPQPVITAVLTDVSADKLDPASLETQVRDMGVVKHDFDPGTNTVRIYLPRPLIRSPVLVNIRVKDAQTGQIMVANWQFNYEPGAGSEIHAPIPTEKPAPAPAPVGAASATPPAPPKTD